MFFKTYHFIKIWLSSVILQNQPDPKKWRINSDPIMEAELFTCHHSSVGTVIRLSAVKHSCNYLQMKNSSYSFFLDQNCA